MKKNYGFQLRDSSQRNEFDFIIKGWMFEFLCKCECIVFDDARPNTCMNQSILDIVFQGIVKGESICQGWYPIKK